MSTTMQQRRREHGLSLVEVLVAITILAVAVAIALTVYEMSRRSFKKGENLTEQQQAVRIAFDRLAADLRLAGYNYNPDGSKTRPDEQIEAAYDTAIVLRADYDAGTPDAITPEETMKGTDFLTVSTGNDEIVAYVLAKPDGSSPDTLTFEADVSNPRNGNLETVNVPNVALRQGNLANPPYTLYRITFNNDPSTIGTSAFVNRTPLIDNVYSLSFRYFDNGGAQLNTPFDLADLSDDIGGGDAVAALNERKSIRRIVPELVGLTRDPDPEWIDTADTHAATRRFRKFTLSNDITPRNIGMVGQQDLASDYTPPTQPGAPTLVPGHCGGLLISWPANPVDDQVAYYRINYGTSPGSAEGQRSVAGTSAFLSGLTDATQYYVTIQAADLSGNLSIKSSEVSATTSNTNTPDAPQNVAVSTDLDGAISVTWDPVTTNTAAVPAGDPAAPLLRDLAGYRLYRKEASAGNAIPSTPLADESVVKPKEDPSYYDTQVVNCRDYRYWVRAVDACGVASDASSPITGNSTASVAPLAPEQLQAFLAGVDRVKIEWKAVREDVDGKSVFIDSYRVYRTPLLPDGLTPTGDAAFTLLTTVQSGADRVEYVDNSTLPVGYVYWYKVTAVDDCGNESEAAGPVKPECAFDGDVVFVSPNTAQVAGPVDVVVRATGSDNYTKCTLEFVPGDPNAPARTEEILSTVAGQTQWTYHWWDGQTGPYVIRATVENETGCSKVEQINVTAGNDVGCCLDAFVQGQPIGALIETQCVGAGNAKCALLEHQMENRKCLTQVGIDRVVVSWIDVTGNDPKLSGLSFDGSTIWNANGAASPASTTLSQGASRDPNASVPAYFTNADIVDVRYAFTQNMTRKQGTTYFQNLFQVTYQFTLLDAAGLDTSIHGTCSFTNLQSGK